MAIARLSKRHDKNASAELGCFRHPYGARCMPAETVHQLKDAHVPKSLNRPNERARSFLSNGISDIEDEKASFISPFSVGVCIQMPQSTVT